MIHSEKTAAAPLLAAGAMVAAMATISFIDIYVVVIAGHVGLWQFQAVRGVLALVLIAGAVLLGFGDPRPKRTWAVAVRSLLVGIGIFLYFGALGFMPLAEALAGLFTSPIFVLLITVLILRQRIGPWRVLAVVIGFVGILLVLNPETKGLSWLLIMPVAGGLFYAFGVVATRTLCEGETTLAMTLGVILAQTLLGVVGLFGLALAGVETVPAGQEGFLLRGWVWPMGPVWHLLVLQAVGSLLAIVLIIRAYQLGEASQVAVLEYTALIFGPSFAFLIMGQAISAWQAFGIGLIALAGIVIAVRSRGEAGA